MAPMISSIKKKNSEIKVLNESLMKEKNKLLQLRKFVESNFEFVGENFSKKAREIYYDRKKKK